MIKLDFLPKILCCCDVIFDIKYPRVESENLLSYLLPLVSEEHYFLIQSVTEKSGENEFVKKKEHLIRKFNELQTTSGKRNNQQITTTYVKLSIINLTDIALTDHQTSLLNLGPKCVATEMRIQQRNYSNGISSIKFGIPE